MTPEEIFAKMEEINPDALTADGFDDCIVGYVERCGSPAVFCYDAQKMAEKLATQYAEEAKKSGEEIDDAMGQAWEYLEFNTFGAFVGENMPMWLYRFAD